MNIVCIGAHPDDPEWYAGAAMAQWARAGHRVLSLALTNGDIGHHLMAGGVLAQRRAAESKCSAERAGIRSLVLDNHDGELMPTLELRRQVVRIIRNERANLVLTDRPWDYHHDHRYISVAVQDAAFMVTVPNFCPDTPALEKNPIFLYMMDTFQKPLPFQPDVVLDVDSTMDIKWAMLDAMASQMYEWLPWLERLPGTVPEAPEARLDYLRGFAGPYFRQFADRARAQLIAKYGDRAHLVEYAELFEICEYGSPPDAAFIAELFPA